MKRINGSRSPSPKPQKTQKTNVEVANSEKRITSDNNSIELNLKPGQFLEVFSYDETLVNLINFLAPSTLIMCCTNKFFNQKISVLIIRHLIAIYNKNNQSPGNVTPFDGLNNIFLNGSKDLDTSVTFFLCASKYFKSLQFNPLPNLPIYLPSDSSKICEKFVQLFNGNFKNHFSKKFEPIINDLIENQKNLVTDFSKIFIAHKFAAEYLNGANLFGLYKNAQSKANQRGDDKYILELVDFIVLVFGFKEKGNTTINLNDLFITAFEECIDGKKDALGLIQTIYQEHKERLNVDFLRSTIEFLKKLPEIETSWDNLYAIIEIISSYLEQKKDLNAEELNSLSTIKECCFTLLDRSSNSDFEDKTDLQISICTILERIIQNSDSCTDTEWEFWATIAKNFIDQFNSSLLSNTFLDRALNMFSTIFKYKNRVLNTYINIACNNLFKVLDPSLPQSFSTCASTLKSLLKYKFAFEKTIDFTKIKKILLEIQNPEITLGEHHSDYHFLLNYLMVTGCIKIDENDFSILKYQFFIILENKNETASLNHQIIEAVCNHCMKCYSCISALIKLNFKEADYQLLKERTMEIIKNPLVQGQQIADFLLYFHKLLPILNESEKELVLTKISPLSITS